MLLIDCPFCGPRDETEFVWGGDIGVRRPKLSCSHEEWAVYVYYRRNMKGLENERWVHRGGCRQWFAIRRDTTTHVIVYTCRLRDAPAFIAGSDEAGP